MTFQQTSHQTHPDGLARLLGEYAVQSDPATDEAARRAVTHILMDVAAVTVGAFRHPAAQAARRYAYGFPSVDGVAIWGSGGAKASVLDAVLANSVPLRGYDYNDLFMGKGTGGHPSDIVPGLLCVAESCGARVSDLRAAIAVSYDVTLSLFDTMPMKSGGWDYVTLTGLGAVCGTARVLRLDAAQTTQALTIAAAYHLATLEVESSELNSRGDLTMWKRFNGANAVRQAVYACYLARSGVEGVVRPFAGRWGLVSRLGLDDGWLTQLESLLTSSAQATRVGQTTFKRWPVGSRGQSAIQAALEARAQLRDEDGEIVQVVVEADPGAYQHLVTARQDPWRPVSRETADHSLPYIVTAAILEGNVTVDSFNLERVEDPERRDFLEHKVKVRQSAGDERRDLGFPTAVSLRTASGRVVEGKALPPPGHPLNPFTTDDFINKLHDSGDPLLGPERVNDLVDAILRQEDDADAASWTSRLSPSDISLIDS
jgi:2-methylcitrate dehydratase